MRPCHLHPCLCAHPAVPCAGSLDMEERPRMEMHLFPSIRTTLLALGMSVRLPGYESRLMGPFPTSVPIYVPQLVCVRTCVLLYGCKQVCFYLSVHRHPCLSMHTCAHIHVCTNACAPTEMCTHMCVHWAFPTPCMCLSAQARVCSPPPHTQVQLGLS